MPVGHVLKHGRDEGPAAAHERLDRVNGAHLVPEDAVAVAALGQQRTASAAAEVAGAKGRHGAVDVGGDGIDVGVGDVGAAGIGVTPDDGTRHRVRDRRVARGVGVARKVGRRVLDIEGKD